MPIIEPKKIETFWEKKMAFLGNIKIHSSSTFQASKVVRIWFKR